MKNDLLMDGRRIVIGVSLALGAVPLGGLARADDWIIRSGPLLETVDSFSVKDVYEELLVNDDGSVVIACESLGRFHAYDVATGAKRWTVQGDPSPHRLNDEQTIVQWVQHNQHPIALIQTDISSGEVVERTPLALPQQKLWNIAFSNRRTHLMAAQIESSPRDEVVVFDLGNGQLRSRWQLPDGPDQQPTTIGGLGLDPDGQHVVIAGRDQLLVCDIEGNLIRRYASPGNSAFSQIRCQSAFAVAHGTLGSDLIGIGFDLDLLRKLPLHPHGVRSSALGSDDRYLVTGGMIPAEDHVPKSDGEPPTATVIASDTIGWMSYESSFRFSHSIRAVGISLNSRIVVAHHYEVGALEGSVHVMRRSTTDADVEQMPSMIPIIMPDQKPKEPSTRQVSITLGADGALTWKGKPITRAEFIERLRAFTRKDQIDFHVQMSADAKLSVMLEFQDAIQEHLTDRVEITYTVK